MTRVALTGGIATGKSYCLARFAELGVPVADADQIAREVVKRGTPGLDAVVARFGPAMRRPDGELDRKALAAVVFADSGSRAALEGIVHPLVYAEISRWFGGLRAGGVAIADIPLLYETGRDADFDGVVVAACSAEQQMARMLARGYASADATARLSAQLPIDEKVRRADYVIDTSGTMEETDRQVGEVWERLRRALV